MKKIGENVRYKNNTSTYNGKLQSYTIVGKYQTTRFLAFTKILQVSSYNIKLRMFSPQ